MSWQAHGALAPRLRLDTRTCLSQHHAMDLAKAAELKRELAEVPQSEQVVSLERFFEGNDDLGSIGCNLIQHPGVGAFRDVLDRVARAPGVEGVYVHIGELDPGPTYWPFSERILVAGAIALEALREAVAVLQADEVWAMESGEIPSPVATRHPGAAVSVIWWD